MHSHTGSFFQPLAVIVFVVIMFLSQLAKVKQKQKQAEMDRVQRETSRHADTSNDDTFDKAPDIGEEIQPKKEEPLQLKATLKPNVVSAVQKAANAAYDSVGPLTEKNIYTIAPPDFNGPGPMLSTYNARELKRLVVWSEVLGRPKALQDEN